MHVNLKSPSVQACLLVIASVSMSGCASLQDWHFCYTNKSRAAEAWKCAFSSESRKCLSADFEAGFKKGYFDTAMNKDCRLPPVAPPKYWSARYQSCEGQACVQEWFRGYQHGIASAQSNSDVSSAEVPVSPCAPVVNKTGCGTCYSPNNCKCGPESIEHTSEFESSMIHEVGQLPVELPMFNESPSVPNPPKNIPTKDAPQQLPSPAVENVNPAETTRIEPADQIFIPVSFEGSQGLIGGFGSSVDK